MKGVFTLKTAADLREKVRRDLEKLRAEPLNVDAAFNFFVTAEHMLDWSKTKDTRKNSTLLRICSHLANGFKHFELDERRHNSVSTAEVCGLGYFTAYSTSYATAYSPGSSPQLIISLENEAADQLGKQSIAAIELAEMVMKYWDNCPAIT